MRWREIGWAAFLAGLPLSPLLLGPITAHKIDLWHSHAWWAWLWLIVLSAGSLRDSVNRTISNIPLAWWTGWIGGWFLISFLVSLAKSGGYTLSLMLAVLHIATGLLMYLLVTQLRSDQVWGIIPWVARAGVALAVYGLLQFFGFEQFFTDVITKSQNQRVIGTIGNPSHFSAYLSCVAPFVLSQSGLRWKIGFGILVLSMLASQSFGGMVALLVVVIWWTFRTHPRWVLAAVCGVLVVIGSLWLLDKSGFEYGSSGAPILSLSGRLPKWAMILSLFKKTLITGAGPGAMLALSESITDHRHLLYHWRHAHNEYLQALIEQGIIGLALMLWIVADCWKKVFIMKQDALVLVLSAAFLAFLTNALYNFPAHLWAMASLGIFAYAGIHVRFAERRV